MFLTRQTLLFIGDHSLSGLLSLISTKNPKATKCYVRVGLSVGTECAFDSKL